MNSNLDYDIYLSFQLNNLRVGLHLLKMKFEPTCEIEYLIK
jgi:hypothetical protein